MSSIWSFHPDRTAAVAEPHARPSLSVSPTDFIYHVGFSCDDAEMAQVKERLGSACEPGNVRHSVYEIDNVQVKLERHTEFSSLTLICGKEDGAVRTPALLKKIVAGLQVEMIVLVQIVMCKSPAQLSKALPFGARLYGGTMRGQLQVQSSLATDDDGVIKYGICTRGSSPDEVGRRIQRLLEMETYRTMSLLGLPAARRIGQQLSDAELGVKQIMGTMNANGAVEEKDLFEQVSQLSQDAYRLQSETRFRFAASRAYFDLTQQRLDSLEEEKLGDLQTISGFVRSRLEPSMATIESTIKRQGALIDDLSAALGLLRTRIDLGLNQDNQALLKSMDARHRQQVLIAQTVEGLSTVAITYYAVGLFSYVVKGNADLLPFGLSPGVVVAASVPAVLVGVWLFLHRMRSRWEKEI